MYQCPEFCREHQTYQAQYALADPSLKASRQEYEIALTFSIHAIFPCLVVQQISDMLAARLIVPKGPDQFMPRCCGRWRCLS